MKNNSVRSGLTAVAGLFALFGAAAQASATQWIWDWDGLGAVNHNGGVINSVRSTFDSDSKRFTYKANFGTAPNGRKTNGFWVAVSPGPNPKGHAGELAIMYFDAESIGSPKLTVYAYNGMDGNTSWKDGSPNGGTQAPDRIKSSLISQNWINALTVTDEGNGSRTLGFDIDATDIQSHTPVYPGPGGAQEWTGLGFGPKIGVWFHPVTGLDANYQDGYLCGFEYRSQGWLDGSNWTATPEPASMLALGAGIAAMVRRRKK